MESTFPVQGDRAIAKAYLERRRKGDADNIEFDSTLEDFCERYPYVPRDVAADLVRFLIAEVKQGSSAWQNGLRPEDIIMRVNQKPVTSTKELAAALAQAGSVIALHLLRSDRILFLVIR